MGCGTPAGSSGITPESLPTSGACPDVQIGVRLSKGAKVQYNVSTRVRPHMLCAPTECLGNGLKKVALWQWMIKEIPDGHSYLLGLFYYSPAPGNVDSDIGEILD